MNLYCSPRHYSISRWKAQGIIRDKLHSVMHKEKTATYFINHLFNLYLFASSLSFSARSLQPHQSYYWDMPGWSL
uniref:Uncharacterized protein n=1 Tax=Anguilla anguilla TaxID=7936 RepID=A0A0E9RRC1_ANGAN